MITILIAVTAFTLLVAMMAVGLLRGLRVKGSCGGLAALPSDQECSVCGQTGRGRCQTPAPAELTSDRRRSGSVGGCEPSA